jgi:hypothetical protein
MVLTNHRNRLKEEGNETYIVLAAVSSATLLQKIQKVAGSGIFVRRLEDDANFPSGLESLGPEGAICRRTSHAAPEEIWVGEKELLIDEGFRTRSLPEHRRVERGQRTAAYNAQGKDTRLWRKQMELK